MPEKSLPQRLSKAETNRKYTSRTNAQFSFVVFTDLPTFHAGNYVQLFNMEHFATPVRCIQDLPRFWVISLRHVGPGENDAVPVSHL